MDELMGCGAHKGAHLSVFMLSLSALSTAKSTLFCCHFTSHKCKHITKANGLCICKLPHSPAPKTASQGQFNQFRFPYG